MIQKFAGTPLDKQKSRGEIFTTSYEPKLSYRWDSGEAIGRYLEELKQGRLIARRCDGCQRVMIPPRMFCERCFRPTDDWVYVNPIVGRAKAALAKHARRNHDPLAAIAAPGDQPALLEFFEIATDGFAAVPTIAQLRFIRSRENLAARFLFVERVPANFWIINIFLLRFLRPHNNDRADLHQIAPSLSDAALGLPGTWRFAASPRSCQ